MRSRPRRFAVLLTGALSLSGAFLLLLRFPRAHAYIEALYSLEEVLDQSTNVVVGKIVEIDRRNRTAVATIERPLKGGKEYDRVQMNFSLGPSIQAKYLLELWRREDPFILYYQRHGSEIKSLAHAGDTWFQLFASHRRNPRRVWWRFTHMEIHFGRTYDGSTPELIRLTDDVLSGRRKPPPPDPRVSSIDVHKLRQRPRRSRSPSGTREERWIEKGAAWRFFKGRKAPGDGWKKSGYDDSSWSRGAAPFGYGDGPFGTHLGDMQRKAGREGYTTVFLRRVVDVRDSSSVRRLEVEADYDDGFILWLNGTRVLAAHPPSGKPEHDSLAGGNHESGTYERFSVRDPSRHLADGRNTVAVQLFNIRPASSDLKFDAEMRAEVASRSGRFRRIVDLERGGGEVRGISWADVNGDELLDVLFCRQGGNALLVNQGDGFTDRTRELGLSGGSRSAVWADYDGDDHPDLLTSDFELFQNVGGRFRKRPLPAPKNRNPEGAGWIDYNGDGRPDILVTNGEHGILLYENTGSGPEWFRDVSREAGLGKRGLGRGNGDFLALGDINGDGYTDFLYNLDGGVLARNDGGEKFRLETGSGIELPGGSGYKRGIRFADFDGDADLDLFVPAPGRPRLYENRNDGTFLDVLDRAGDLSRSRDPSFSSAWGDVDGDGNLDLFVCHTRGESRLYLGDGKGKFRDVTAEVGLEGLRPAFAASFADADGDGDLDLAVNLERRVVVFSNDLESAPGKAAVIVRVQARRGVTGSVVRALDGRGRPIALRELDGGQGCGGQGAPVVHVAVPEGRSRITVALSDGRFAARKVDVEGDRLDVRFRERDFR